VRFVLEEGLPMNIAGKSKMLKNQRIKLYMKKTWLKFVF